MTPPRQPVAPPLEAPLEAVTTTGPEGEALVLDSARILSGRTEVVIRHNGRHYRLRCTRLGKLILTA
ncbi:hemin uptake protein HemP [Usitatibacter palustris]|uniref:Hemin uptake protein HemP n=1 Tax=Usitatibacter palustris TaxID=2732487 RepID=A0A6M4H8V3_9PROT|nr:hemin uptake protein HemP [Usitatibacter palustris]QJR15153.1 hypothetical protein DSM104440_01970 [Usitatibacter palustris]